jgi:sec-independent protein translocase protein TatA
MTQFFAFSMPGGPEMIIIFLLILVLFGAKKLPELARALGKSTLEFKRARQEIEDEIARTESDLKLEQAREKQPHSGS